MRSGMLVAWATAWLAGHVASDDVLHATAPAPESHSVLGLPGQDGAVPLSALLIHWRMSRTTPWLVLPAPGDVRGLVGPDQFRQLAVEVGEAVVGDGLGIVPEVVDVPVSSAPARVIWRCFSLGGEAAQTSISVADAQYELTEAIRDSASALAAADVAGTNQDVSSALRDARRVGERLRLPPGFPPRAVQLIAQAERIRLILDLAGADPVGGAIDRAGIVARAEILRPLATAVRQAQVAGFNALCEEAARTRG